MFETEEAKEVYVILKTVESLIGSEVMRKFCLSSIHLKEKWLKKCDQDPGFVIERIRSQLQQDRRRKVRSEVRGPQRRANNGRPRSEVSHSQ